MDRRHIKDLTFSHFILTLQHVPDYYKVVSQPMQLSTIKSKLQPAHFNHYQSVDEYIADMRLMFNNCYLYNGVGIIFIDE